MLSPLSYLVGNTHIHTSLQHHFNYQADVESCCERMGFKLKDITACTKTQSDQRQSVICAVK